MRILSNLVPVIIVIAGVGLLYGGLNPPEKKPVLYPVNCNGDAQAAWGKPGYVDPHTAAKRTKAQGVQC